VLNRAVARLPLFECAADYDAFTDVLLQALRKEPLPIFAYSLMPNHWHFVVRPDGDQQVSSFFRWLTHTHTMRWHACHHTVGTGHLYQGRFKAFPIEEDDHLLAVMRYVERNPVRASLCRGAEQWRYGSAWHRTQNTALAEAILRPWPIPRPASWLDHVNQPQTVGEVDAIRSSVTRGTPYGTDGWVSQTAVRLGVRHTLRPRGRPEKGKKGTQLIFLEAPAFGRGLVAFGDQKNELRPLF
jgi:putative transposase